MKENANVAYFNTCYKAYFIFLQFLLFVVTLHRKIKFNAMRKQFFCLLSFSLLALSVAAQVTVKGVVMAQGEADPVIGANVVIKGTTVGTITDLDGAFSLEAQPDQTITISFIGYASQEYKANKVPAKITLVPDNVMLEEVVAVGYGTMRKSDLTGAVSSVRAEDLQKTPLATVDQALQGKAAGVTVNANSGQPGAPAEIRIRGIGTVKSDASPIYVVDGVVLKDISFLSPTDIASMEIMKDASSTAIYGSQAANGVILITTKSGDKNRKAAISFNAYWGLQNRWNKLKLLNAHDQAELEVLMAGGAKAISNWDKGFDYWWKKTNNATNKNPYYPVNFDEMGWSYSEQETDWQDEVFRKNALVQNYSLSVDGGGDWGQYMFSASYFNQDGTIKGSNYERLTLRLNTRFNVRKWLVIGENLAMSSSRSVRAMNNNSSPQASILSAALAMAPWDPVRYPEGAKNGLGEDIGNQISAASNFTNVVNPMSMITTSVPNEKNMRWVGDIYIEIKPVKGLTIRPSLSMDFANNLNRTFNYAYMYSSADYRLHNSVSAASDRYMTLTNDNVITYARDIQKHSFSIMVGETMQQYDYYGLSAGGQDIVNVDERNWYIFNTKKDSTRMEGDAVARTRRLSFFTRLHYSYDNRYIATFNFRADASSKFKKSNSGVWGFFPSLALAWRINQEEFMEKSSDYLDNLKLRFGWGRVGNDQVDESAFVQKIETPGPYFVGYMLNNELVPGAAVLTLVNENGRWETNEQWNIGLDFGFWKGMLTGTVEGYIRDTKDAILSVNAPAHVGNRWAVSANLGTVRNMGIELTLGHQHHVGDFHYSISANLSFIKNEVTKMNGGSPDWGDRTKTDKGLAVRSFWGYKYLGVYRTDEEAAAHLPNSTNVVNAGDAKYEDLNKDGKIDDNDCQVIGSPFPWLNGALNFSLGWKGIDFSLSFQGVYGNKIYNALRERLEGTGQTCTLSSKMTDVFIYYNQDKRDAMESAGINWQAYMDEYNGSIPNPHGNTMNNANSTRFLEDGAYLRLKDLTLGYTLPNKYSKKAYIERIRIYFSASNLLTLTKYTGYDPEVGGGVDYGNYPQSRTFMFGINVDF